MKRKIKCLIVDDEPLAREGMARYISRVDALELAGECEDAMELDRRLKSGEDIDLLFLDIEMPMISGLDYLTTLDNPPMVILTTAYGQYALQGYELNVVDYLLKPVSFARFIKAVNKACAFFSLKSAHTKRDFMFLRSDKKLHRVKFSEILYVEAVENYVKVVADNDIVVTRTPLKALLAELPAESFMQVHKSFAVNMDRVTSIEGNMLSLPGASIQVSRGYKDVLTAWLDRK